MVLSITDQIRGNLGDALSFGPRFLLRHFSRRAATSSVHVPGFGPIVVRSGTSDVSVLRQVFQENQYDVPWLALRERIRHLYQRIISTDKTPVIVDAGANIGAASRWFAQKFPAAQVVAIEPEPGNATILCRNTNHRITPIIAAVGSQSGFVSIIDSSTGWGARTERSSEGIPVVTMANAFGSVANGSPFIAKIDIEGFEAELFANNTEWLSDVPVVYIEPHEWMLPGKKTSHSFQREMAKHDFDLFVSGEMLVYVR